MRLEGFLKALELSPHLFAFFPFQFRNVFA